MIFYNNAQGLGSSKLSFESWTHFLNTFAYASLISFSYSICCGVAETSVQASCAVDWGWGGVESNFWVAVVRNVYSENNWSSCPSTYFFTLYLLLLLVKLVQNTFLNFIF